MIPTSLLETTRNDRETQRRPMYDGFLSIVSTTNSPREIATTFHTPPRATIDTLYLTIQSSAQESVFIKDVPATIPYDFIAHTFLACGIGDVESITVIPAHRKNVYNHHLIVHFRQANISALPPTSVSPQLNAAMAFYRDVHDGNVFLRTLCLKHQFSFELGESPDESGRVISLETYPNPFHPAMEEFSHRLPRTLQRVEREIRENYDKNHGGVYGLREPVEFWTLFPVWVNPRGPLQIDSIRESDFWLEAKNIRLTI